MRLLPPPLAEWLVVDAGLQRRDEGVVLADPQPRLVPLVGRHLSELVQPGPLGLADRRVRDLRQRLAPPQPVRLAQDPFGIGHHTLDQQAPTLGEEALEADGVDPVTGHGQAVAVVGGDHHVGAGDGRAGQSLTSVAKPARERPCATMPAGRRPTHPRPTPPP